MNDAVKVEYLDEVSTSGIPMVDAALENGVHKTARSSARVGIGMTGNMFRVSFGLLSEPCAQVLRKEDCLEIADLFFQMSKKLP
jgi:hypothetical protein